MKDAKTDPESATRAGPMAGGARGAPKENWPILPILIVALVVVAALWLGPALLAGKPQTPPQNVTNTTAADRLGAPGAVLLLSGASRLENLPGSYQISFMEIVDGVESNVTLAQDGGSREATVSTAYHSRKYVWANGTGTVCETELDQPELCSSLVGNSSAGLYALRLNATFPTKESADQQALDEWMVGIGAIRFIGSPQNKTVAGRTCDDVAYLFDFSSLSDADLSKIDPSLFVFKNYRLEKCIDRQNGIPLYTKLQYDYQGVPQEFERTYSSYESPAALPIAASAPNANWTQVDTAFNEDNAVLQSMGVCIAQNTSQDRESCVLSAAINLGEYGLCAFASEPSLRDECVYKLAAVKDEPLMCAKAGTYMDECYIYAAYTRQDASYCNIITNQTDKAACDQAVRTAGNASAAPDLNSAGRIVTMVGRAQSANTSAGNSTGTGNDTGTGGNGSAQ